MPAKEWKSLNQLSFTSWFFAKDESKVNGNFPEGLQWTKPYACTSAFFVIGKLHVQLEDLESMTSPFISLLKEEEVSVEL